MSNDDWELPMEGQKGTIKNTNTNMVLGLKDDETTAGIVVIEEIADGTNFQKWKRSLADSSGHFTLTNSNKVLTASDTGDKLTNDFINEYFLDDLWEYNVKNMEWRNLGKLDPPTEAQEQYALYMVDETKISDKLFDSLRKCQ